MFVGAKMVVTVWDLYRDRLEIVDITGNILSRRVMKRNCQPTDLLVALFVSLSRSSITCDTQAMESLSVDLSLAGLHEIQID